MTTSCTGPRDFRSSRAAIIFREIPTALQGVGIAVATAGLLMICGTVGHDFSVAAFAILALQTRGYRRFELAIAGLLGIVWGLVRGNEAGWRSVQTIGLLAIAVLATALSGCQWLKSLGKKDNVEPPTPLTEFAPSVQIDRARAVAVADFHEALGGAIHRLLPGRLAEMRPGV